MSLHVLEWNGIRDYDLLDNSRRCAFTNDLRATLDRCDLYVEEAVVIYRKNVFGGKIDEDLRRLGLVAEDAFVEAVFLPVHKPFPTKPTRISHAASRVDFVLRSAYSAEELVADYLGGMETVRIMYEDQMRRGESLIVCRTALRGELFEALGKLGARASELIVRT